MLAMAFVMALTLEPINGLCTISTVQLVLLCDGLAQSPSEAVPSDLQEGPGVWFLVDGQSVVLWEEDVWKSLFLFTGLCDGLSSLDFVGVLNCLLRASNCFSCCLLLSLTQCISKQHLLPWFVSDGHIVSLELKEHLLESGRGACEALLMYHFQWFVV